MMRRSTWSSDFPLNKAFQTGLIHCAYSLFSNVGLISPVNRRLKWHIKMSRNICKRSTSFVVHHVRRESRLIRSLTLAQVWFNENRGSKPPRFSSPCPTTHPRRPLKATCGIPGKHSFRYFGYRGDSSLLIRTRLLNIEIFARDLRNAAGRWSAL